MYFMFTCTPTWCPQGTFPRWYIHVVANRSKEEDAIEKCVQTDFQRVGNEVNGMLNENPGDLLMKSSEFWHLFANQIQWIVRVR